MTLRLTPDMLAGCYDFLRSIKPFSGWKLPDSDGLEFRVENHGDRFGHFIAEKGQAFPIISVSQFHVTTLDLLTRVVAHEAVHLRQHLRDQPQGHGRSFQIAARQICDACGFEIRVF